MQKASPFSPEALPTDSRNPRKSVRGLHQSTGRLLRIRNSLLLVFPIALNVSSPGNKYYTTLPMRESFF